MAEGKKKSKGDGPKMVFRVTDSQKRKVKRSAEKLGMTESDFAKAMIFSGLYPEEIQDKVLVDLLNQMRQLYLPLSELSKSAFVPDSKMSTLGDELKSVFRQLCEDIQARQ